MTMVRNIGITDKTIRIVLGLILGITGILVNGYPYVGRLLGIVGALFIISATWGT